MKISGLAQQASIIVVVIVLSFGAGAGCHWAYSRQNAEPTVDELWRLVNKYHAHLKDPGNLEGDASLGMTFVRPPFDLDPILAELVAKGELWHLDVILPTVPRERQFVRHALAVCDVHPEFVEVRSREPSFRVAGQQPLSLELWVKKNNEALVQQLIDELEAIAAHESAAL